MKKPLVIPILADNGEHSHWALIDIETGKKLWSENPKECRAMGFPVICQYSIDGECFQDDLPPFKCDGNKINCKLDLDI